ncbi:MAG: thiamine pyrophosphate-dependent enzyme [Bacteroidota bacterium]
MIDESKLESFIEHKPHDHIALNGYEEQIDFVIEKIKKSKCPVFYIGHGIRLANSITAFFTILDKFPIPVVTAINGHDLIWFDHQLFFGRPGICGDRLGNIMVQNCDLLIVLGTRLGVRQTSYSFDNFAPNAFKIMIDIDNAELLKPTLHIDLKINLDIKTFIELFCKKTENQNITEYTPWIDWGRNIERNLPTILEDNIIKKDLVNSYVFADILFKTLPGDSLIVTGNGTAYTSTFQIMKIKKGMRVIANQGCASMGYDLPAAIGACIANDKRPIYLITGDGSIMMNLQELQTIFSNKLPIKIFILNNNGYLAIRTTQTSFFNKNFIGESPASGISLPDFLKVAKAFNIKYYQISSNSDIPETVLDIIHFDGPVICNLEMDPEQTLHPKVASSTDKNGKISSRPLEDMFPFLSESDLLKCYYNNKSSINL